jgi:hypothetical protein
MWVVSLLLPLSVHAESLGELNANPFNPDSTSNPFGAGNPSNPKSPTNPCGHVSTAVSLDIQAAVYRMEQIDQARQTLARRDQLCATSGS